jgi:hypothetical protein
LINKNISLEKIKMREEKMKKHLIVLFTLVTISVISFTACEPFIENKIIVKNSATNSNGVTLVVRGVEYPIPSGETLILNDFNKGEFEYSTIYSFPIGFEPSAEGDVSGTFKLNAGTELLLKYSDRIDSTSYTIFGLLSSSDDINRPDPFDDEENP